MKYQSTRGKEYGFSAAAAIKQGIAADGGLFVPEWIPVLSRDFFEELLELSYSQRAERIMALFLSDFSVAEVQECVTTAYESGSFDHPDRAPLQRLSESVFIQELWHGPTSAFKDMALQMLPQLMTRSAAKTGEQGEIVILVATSGDTGKAALEGFKDIPGTRIVVFYPAEGVSPVQERQMITQLGANVHVIAVEGNFDDTQNGVKAILADEAVRVLLQQRGLRLSSANSINWGRLLPQIVYYISAWLDLRRMGAVHADEAINFVVPTGNFGNILAAWYARAMGLPVNRLICASNANNVLTEFLNSGRYDRKRPFTKTLSPSMDILISSNLERLLYELTGHDAERVSGWMRQLKEQGEYQVETDVLEQLHSLFYADWVDDRVTQESIGQCWERQHYLLDTHTAVACKVYRDYLKATGDQHVSVIVSTASPYKFASSVMQALPGDRKDADEFADLAALAAYTAWPVPEPLRHLQEKPIRHQIRCTRDEMMETLLQVLAEH